MPSSKPKIHALNRKWRQSGVWLDHLLSRFYGYFFGKHPVLAVAACMLVYVSGLLFGTQWLQESANFFVVLPVLAFALVGGLPGGTLAGVLGLPANLLLLTMLGHLQYAPKSWWMAELAGIILGTALGYLSDYFHRVDHEITRRKAAGRDLMTSLWERNALLDEMDHRVRNNLNLVRSLIRLQARRSAGYGFGHLVENIDRRIMAIAKVYELLQVTKQHAFVDPRAFLASLLHEIGITHDASLNLEESLQVEGGESLFSLQTATAIGLIVNEAVSNAWQHGRSPDGQLRLTVVLRVGGPSSHLRITDGGAGFDPDKVEWGLGLDLIALQVGFLGGSYGFSFGPGAVLDAEFPGLT